MKFKLNIIGLIQALVAIMVATVTLLVAVPQVIEAVGGESPEWIPHVIAVLSALSGVLVKFTVDENKNNIPDILETAQDLPEGGTGNTPEQPPQEEKNVKVINLGGK